MGRLVVLSGPSCIGKGPLHAALRKFYPEPAGKLRKMVLYNSRSPRPAETDGVDYHFRTRDEIEALRGRDAFIVLDVRGDLQALDLNALKDILSSSDAFFEGNPFVVIELQNTAVWREVETLSIFLSPLSREEIVYLQTREPKVSMPEFLTDVMRRKLLRRTQKQKGILSLKDLENIERRCSSAYREIKEAWRFDHVIVNHDGEDSENWDAFYYPVGDARRALLAFAGLLTGREVQGIETWDRDLLA